MLSLYRIKKQYIAGVFLGSLIFSLFSPIAHAFPFLGSPTETLPPVPTSDNAVRSKEVGITVFGITVPGISFDSFMIAVVKKLLEKMSDAVVDYINNGFRGPDGGRGPAFAVDFEGFLLNVGNEVGGQFIESIGAGVVCSPFRAQLISSLRLRLQTVRSTDPSRTTCTLTGALQNVENFFAGDFSAGGWQTWFEVTQNQSNNPVGSFLQLEGELAYRVQSARETEAEKVAWGDGFLSFEECVEEGPDGKCKVKNTRTPGTVIEGQLQDMLGSEIAQLELADEFDEIVSAMVGQLVGKVFSSGGGGLINTGPTYNWSGGGYGGNPAGGAGPQCYPNVQNAYLSASTTVTWTVRSVGGNNPTYVWSGDEGLSGSGQTASIIYQTIGKKKAQVQVTDTRMVNGTPQTATQTIQCSPEVEIERPPLKVECTPDKTWYYLGSPAPTSLVTYNVKITGGSGSYVYRVEIPPHTHGLLPIFQRTSDSDKFVTPPVPATDSTAIQFVLTWLPFPRANDDNAGTKVVRIIVHDNDLTIRKLEASCGSVDVVKY